MTDFLERFEQQRQARMNADRTFEFAGETFRHRPSVAYEVTKRLEHTRRQVAREVQALRQQYADANGDEGVPTYAISISDDEMFEAAEGQILACLEPESHEAWARLRDPDAAYPLSASDVFEFADYLAERLSEIPTDAPAGSSAGRTTTGNGSTAASPSADKTLTGSVSGTT